MFDKTKVKSWIKKAHKSPSFGYGHGYITDGYVMLVDEPRMHPTILEVFGTLTPECKYSAEQFQQLMNLPDEPIEVIDSKLEYVPDPKSRLRIFYDPKTGQELTINGVYFDLLDSPRAYKFYTNDSMTTMWIVYDEEVVGVVAPLLLQGQLSHISFNRKIEVVVIEAGPDYTDRLESFEMKVPEDEDQAVAEAMKAVEARGYSVIPNDRGGCNEFNRVSYGEDYIAVTVAPNAE
jgi:hypothetical protein